MLVSSEVREKWDQITDILNEVMFNSEGLQLCCFAKDENDWEYATGLLIEEIIDAMGEGCVEPWTPEDRKAFQREQLEYEIARAQRRLDELNK
jgi:hypothetical protein